MGVPPAEVKAFATAERVTSAISLFGAGVVIITFILNPKFRKSINRLVFYATFGNVIVNITTIIGPRGYTHGTDTSLCQFQAFTIHWFICADVLWTFAMAINVWLSFFRSYSASSLRRLESKYLIACYGITFVPAFVMIFVKSHSKGRVYGSAVLYCWISTEWDPLRFALAYVPIWLVILVIFSIYIRVGTAIWKWRKSLLSSQDYATEDISESQTGRTKTSDATVTRLETQPEGNNASAHKREPPNAFTNTQRDTVRSQSRAAVDANKAALKYCKCALLFFIALTITWIPSSINRVYTLTRPDNPSFGLNLAQAIVLPLQGFWNAVIYLSTSPYAVRSTWDDFRHLFKRRNPNQDSLQMHQKTPLPSDTPEDIVLEPDTSHTIHYDGERPSSQRELVGRC